ncbi:MAG: FtsQ-type POTRA domain-containing protein [Nitrospirota bacterium]
MRRKGASRPGPIGRRWQAVRVKTEPGWLLLWAAGLAILGWGWSAAYERAEPVLHEWLEIREVTVTGIRQVTRAEVLERLALAPGETQWSVRPQVLATRLEVHPWIKRAVVSRSLPHGLDVAIVERQPAAVLRAPGLRLLLDGEGSVLTVLSPGEDPGLPLLVGVEPEGLMQGEERARRAAQTGIKLAGLLENEFPDRPEVDLGNPDNAVAYVGGLRFHFGPSPFEEKWDRYRKITTHCTSDPLLRPVAQRVATGLPEQGAPGNGCPARRVDQGDDSNRSNEVDLRYPGKVILRERG